jgi:hypothetical protein
MGRMIHRPQFSLKTLLILVSIWCVISAYRTTLPVMIACAVFTVTITLLLLSLAPIRFALDAVDRAVIRIKGERLD